MKVFLSYLWDRTTSLSLLLVCRVSYYLSKQKDMYPWFYGRHPVHDCWPPELVEALKTADKFVFFLGNRLGDTQQNEYNRFRDEHGDKAGNIIIVKLPNAGELPSNWIHSEIYSVDRRLTPDLMGGKLTSEAVATFEMAVQECARNIFEHFIESSVQKWIPPDGLPLGYPFSYEKTIIEEYVNGNGCLLTPSRVAAGCPIIWPQVTKRWRESDAYHNNPIPEAKCGKYRPEHHSILVDARWNYRQRSDGDRGQGDGGGDDEVGGRLEKQRLTFPEAGPRSQLFTPQEPNLRVGIIVSGGIAPGINSVLAGIVQRHSLYREYAEQSERGAKKVTFIVYPDGLAGVADHRKKELKEDEVSALRDQSTMGGSALSTSRFDGLLEIGDRQKRENFFTKLIEELRYGEIDILYVIGGDGSMRAAHAIATRLENVIVVAIPKTVDNDVLWVWQTFGFSSAVEKAKDYILQLSTEARSNPRLCVAQLFGSDSGFLVSHAALASGTCLAALIPEVNFTMARLSDHICKALRSQYEAAGTKGLTSRPHGVVLLGENAIPLDAEDYIDCDNYSNLVLDEAEKASIRGFMGSPLLTIKDIPNWEPLASALVGCKSQGGQQRQLWDALNGDVQAILGDREGALSGSEMLQSFVLVELNRLLKKRDLWEREPDSGVSEAAAPADCAAPSNASEPTISTGQPTILDKALALIDNMRGKQSQNFTGDDVKQLVDMLRAFPVSCDANEMLDELERRSTGEWGELSKRENQRLIDAIMKRIVERRNRLRLEEILPDGVITRSPKPKGSRRIQGQTPDEFRTGGLKIVANVLQQDIRDLAKKANELGAKQAEYWSTYRVFKNEPRHLIRSATPNAPDVIFGHRLAVLAVDNAMAGYTDFMISQWLTEYVMVPLDLVVQGRKRVPHGGIFWKSVLASTGQPDMV